MKLTIIIPLRETDTAERTLNSLAKQTFQDFKIVQVKDKGKGAPYARNKGFKQVDTEFVLFSDNDIDWLPNALENLLETIDGVSYSYGAYTLEGGTLCNKEFDGESLKTANYISTMSLIRTKDFPGFDESLKRLQDWDLWLTMLSQGKIGKYCGKKIFSTTPSGISVSKGYAEAKNIVQKKHGFISCGSPR